MKVPACATVSSMLQTNCDVDLPEFELQTIIGGSYLRLLGDDQAGVARRVAACANTDIRPVRVKGIRRAWNAPGLQAQALRVSDSLSSTQAKL
jgi:hypothetical protein